MKIPTISLLLLSQPLSTNAFQPSIHLPIRRSNTRLYELDSEDANKWISTDETYEKLDDWETDMAKRQDGSLWSNFESSSNGDDDDTNSDSASSTPSVDSDDGEAWLDALASVAADEIEFINTEAERADKVRQMQEWGFEAETIKNTLDVAVDDSAEIDEDNEVFEMFKEETAKTGFGMYLDDEVDMETVESHVSGLYISFSTLLYVLKQSTSAKRLLWWSYRMEFVVSVPMFQ